MAASLLPPLAVDTGLPAALFIAATGGKV